jgi:L-asparaginase
MSRVAVVFTGGTISMVNDPVAGGNVPTLDGAAILARTPGLDAIADVVPIDLSRTPASHFSFPGLFEIAGIIRRAQDDPLVDGVVVVQGTDTIEETAFLWDLVLDRPEPVVVTGAMRTSSSPDYDGPRNLRDAVRAAAAPELRGQGVMVVLAGTIEAADDVTKTHASAFDTFKSLNAGPLGSVGDPGVSLTRRRGGRRHIATDRAAEDVVLITAHVAMDGSLLEAAVAVRPSGIVVAATGAGNTSSPLLEAATRAMAAGSTVVLTTRSPSGAASADYAFRGGGATWVRAGALLAGHLGGPKARVALAAGLGAGLAREDLAALLADPPGWPGDVIDPDDASAPSAEVA